MTETQGQVAKILELLTTQNVQRGRARSRSPSPSPNGPCYQCMEPGHIARNCPKRSRSPSPFSKGGEFPKAGKPVRVGLDGHHPAQATDMGQTPVFSATNCESVTSTCLNSDSGGHLNHRHQLQKGD